MPMHAEPTAVQCLSSRQQNLHCNFRLGVPCFVIVIVLIIFGLTTVVTLNAAPP